MLEDGDLFTTDFSRIILIDKESDIFNCHI